MKPTVWTLLFFLATNCSSQETRRKGDSRAVQPASDAQGFPASIQPEPASVDGHSSPGVSGMVSTEELRLPVKAAHELQLSEKAYRSGDWRSSAAHLENLLAIDPRYWPAHNALGQLYVILNEYDQAVKEFEKAAASEPHPADALNNLSVALFLLR